MIKTGTKYYDNSEKKAQDMEVQKIKNSLGKEGCKGDFSEEVHASEGWWQKKDLKRKGEESKEISSRLLKFSR